MLARSDFSVESPVMIQRELSFACRFASAAVTAPAYTVWGAPAAAGAPSVMSLAVRLETSLNEWLPGAMCTLASLPSRLMPRVK